MAFLETRGPFLGLLLLLAGVPLVFVPNIYDAFELPKFLTLLTGLSLFYLLSSWQKPRNRIQATHFTLALFYGALFLSSLLSRDPFSSLFGTYRREEGLIAFTLYVLVFFGVTRFPLKAKEWQALVTTLLVVTSLISLHALLQHFGLDFFGKQGEERSFSTLNHPNFLGAYLAMLLPFFIDQFLRSSSRFARPLLGAGYFLSVVALLYTYSRASWLAAFFSHLVFFWIYPLPKKKEIVAALSGAFFLLLAVGSLPILSRSTFTLYSRLLSIANPRDPSSAARLSTWQSALDIGRDAFWLGVGLDGYKNTFPLYKRRNYVQFEGVHITADKTHNEFLHYFATLGIVGFFAYLWFLLSLFYSLMKRPRDRAWSALFSAVLLAYLVQAFFSFSVIALGTFFYAFCGFAITPPEEPLQEKKRKVKPIPYFSRLLFSLSLGLFLFSLFYSVLRLKADQAHLLARVSFKEGDPEAGVTFAKWSLAFPYVEDYWIYLGKNEELLSAKKQRERVSHLYRAAEAYRQAIARYPGNAYLYSFLGKVYVSLSEEKGRAWLKKAQQLMQRAHHLDPYNPVFLNNAGAVYNKLNQPKKAEPYLREATELTPSYNLAWSNLGIARYKLKDYEGAEKALKKALALSPHHLASLKLYLYLLVREGKLDEANALLSTASEAVTSDRDLLQIVREIERRKARRSR